MSDAVGVKKPITTWESRARKPLDEAAWHAWGQYAFGAVFAAVALLYNPLAPVFGFAGNWQRALVVAAAIPFVTSLVSRDLKAAHID